MSPSSLCRPRLNAPPVGGEWVLDKLSRSSSWPSVCSEATRLSQAGAVPEHGQPDPSGQRCPLPAARVCVWIFVIPGVFPWFETVEVLERVG